MTSFLLADRPPSRNGMTSMLREITPGGVARLSASIANGLAAAIAERGEALIAVSGGRSPIPLFEALSIAPIEWDKVTVALVDERWVSPEDPDSNEALVRKRLLVNRAAAARFVPMKNDAFDPWAGQPVAEEAYAALPRPFDIILLGMGEDGHTASLFPGAAQLSHGLITESLTLGVRPPVAPHDRLSLSLRAILDARRIVLPLSGEKKLAVYHAALGDGPVEQLPIRAVLRQSVAPVEVWIED